MESSHRNNVIAFSAFRAIFYVIQEKSLLAWPVQVRVEQSAWSLLGLWPGGRLILYALLLLGTIRVAFFGRCSLLMMLKLVLWNKGREVRFYLEWWLEEMSRCGLGLADTRLCLVPRSLADRSVAGVLVIPPEGASITDQPAALPCRLVAGRLFVPLDARLSPPIADSEVRGLCPLPVNFLHPVFGLSGFELDSTMRGWDVLQAPREGAGAWNAARPGRSALPEFQGITLVQPPSLADVFGGAEQEIAAQPPEELPPAPGEPKSA